MDTNVTMKYEFDPGCFDCLSNLDTNVKEDTIIMMDYEFDTGWIRFLFQSGYEC